MGLCACENARAAKLSILIITQAAGIPVDAIANLMHMTTESRQKGTSALGKFTLARPAALPRKALARQIYSNPILGVQKAHGALRHC
jgi:hypothetical protein